MLKGELGVTLIELIIAFIILCALSLIAIPSFVTFIRLHRLYATTEHLVQSLQTARSEAVKQGKYVYVSFTTGNSWCYGLNLASACNCQVANACNLGSFSAANPQQMTLNVGTGTNIFFEWVHGAANTSNTITLTPYGDTSFIQIQVGRLGHIQVCATGISGYTPC